MKSSDGMHLPPIMVNLLVTDVFTKSKRSAVMARIRSRGNRDTELSLVRLLRAHGITGWRRHFEICGRARSPLRAGIRESKAGVHRSGRPTFRVKPDFVFPKQRVAIFVDGCFWHGCPEHSPPARWLRKSSMPATADPSNGPKAQRTGKLFWRQKLAANMARDRRVSRALHRAGWRVLRIWEHELQGREARPAHPDGGRTSGRDIPTKAALVRRIQKILKKPQKNAKIAER